MKRSRFTEEQIIGVLREQEAGSADGGCVPQARDQPGDVLPVEGEVWRAGGVRGAAAADAGGGERAAEEAAGRGDAGQRDAERRGWKKMVTPAARREAVAHLREHHAVSERRACRVLGADRTAVRYRSIAAGRCCDTCASAAGLGGRAAPVRVSASGAAAGARGRGLNHKKLRRLYARGAAAGAPSWRAQAGAGHAGADGAAGRRRTSGGRWISCPTRCRTGGGSGCCAWSTTARRECLALVADTSLSGAAGGARAGRDRGRARAAADGGQRQRDGADEHGDPALVAGARRGLALHRAGQAAAERVRRELQRPAAGRMPERDGVHLAAAGAGGAGGVAARTTTRCGRTRRWEAARPAGSACRRARLRQGRCASPAAMAFGQP